MKIAIEITPDESLTESDFRAMKQRAAEDGVTLDQWAANKIRAALQDSNRPPSNQARTTSLALAAA